MGKKGIDEEGLKLRTIKYRQNDVPGMFGDVREINEECVKADKILAESGLEEFSSMGYEDLSGKIDKIESDLEILEAVPGSIIAEFIDEIDENFSIKISKAYDIMEEIQIDDISLGSYCLDSMLSLDELRGNGDERIVLSKKEEAERIIFYQTKFDSLTVEEKKKYDYYLSLALGRSGMQSPYSVYEFRTQLKGLDREEMELSVRLICGDYDTFFDTDFSKMSEGTKQALADYNRRLLPAKMTDETDIDTRQLIAFNNAVFDYSSNPEAVISFLFDECSNRRESSDYLAKTYYQTDDFDKYNEDYYAYYQLERLWGFEWEEVKKYRYTYNVPVNTRFKINNVCVDVGKTFCLEGTKMYPASYRNDVGETFSCSDRQLTYTEEEFDQYLKDNGWTREEYYSLVLDQFTYLDMFDSVLDDNGELAKDANGRIAYDASSNRKKFTDKLERGYVTIDEYLAICSNNTEYNARYLSSEYNQKLAPRKREFDIVFNAIRINPDIGKMQIAYASRAISKDGKIGWDDPKYHEGTDAFAIKDGEKVYVACRGTSDREWVDDGLRACVKSSKREDLTQQMNEMLDFFEDVGDKEEWNLKSKHPNLSLIVTGHSQGGNDAQMLTLLSKYRDQIETCYSFDGEGHSPELIRDLKKTIGEEKYNELIKKMYNACGQEDYVHPLAENVILPENMKYVKLVRQDGVKVGLTQMHDQVSMFAQENPYTGEIEHTGLLNTTLDENGDKLEAKISEKITGALWNTVKEMPPETREKCAVTMLSLFQGIKSGNMEGIEGREITVDDALYFLCNYLPREEVLGITTFKLPEPIKQEVKQTIRKVDGCYDVARIATAEMVSDAVQVYQLLKNMGMTDELIIMDVLSAF